RLRLQPGPGGGPGRRGLRARARRLALPHLPRHRRRLHPRRRHRRDPRAVPGQLALRLRPAAMPRRAAHHSPRDARTPRYRPRHGNDVLSLYGATRAATDRARGGGGPTLIEAVTYRIEPHTTADDDTRYRSADEIDAWRARDPLERFLALLRESDMVDDAFLAT